MASPRPRPAGRLSGASRARAASAERDQRRPIGSDRADRRRGGLTKRYGDLVAVDNLDLEVHAGEIFGLLGQNGAGKTTTILMLLGLTEPTAAAARVVGLRPDARSPLEVKRRVGYLPDNVGLLRRHDRPREPPLHGAAQRPRAAARPRRRIGEVLEQVGMTDRADDRTSTRTRGACSSGSASPTPWSRIRRC